ncbi:MAG: peptide/nickel transport system substrate-binding protein [Acidobacteriota bacterium]|jgi:peptide/nickel transport system substrate-binding protein|nr:peptide/nickel transport system substrate-binding protein [Acidobacteriota bacterium]
MAPSAHGRLARLLPSTFLAASLALTGCGGGSEGKPGIAPNAGAGAPRRGGTVVLGWSADIKGVNELVMPSSLLGDEALFRVFLHLVEEQPDFMLHPPTFAPQLARSYEWSPDHKTLTFHLRENAVWSDGVPVTAEDVRWTWQAETDRAVAWDAAYSKQSISDVEVVDPHTARFHFTHAYAKQMLDANEGVILPKHLWSQLPFDQWRTHGDWFHQHLVADGPFLIESWKPQQELVLARNPRYYDPTRPYLDRVVIRIVPDTGSLSAQLFSGAVDFIPQVSPTDADRIKKDPRLDLIAYWYRLIVALAWNNQRPPFDDPAVRRALTMGIDRKAIVETLMGPYGRIATSPYVSDVWAHDRSITPLPYDPAEARRILAGRGFADHDGDGVLDRGGKPLAFEVTSNSGNRQRNDAAVMIQDQLKKIGVRAQPRVLEFNTMVAQIDAGSLDATIVGMGMDTSLDLTGNFASSSIKEGSNYARYANPEIDRLIVSAMARPNLLDSLPDLLRIQEILHRDQPSTLLWESQRLNGINRRVHGARPNPLFSLFHLEDWWVEPAR